MHALHTITNEPHAKQTRMALHTTGRKSTQVAQHGWRTGGNMLAIRTMRVNHLANGTHMPAHVGKVIRSDCANYQDTSTHRPGAPTWQTT